MPQNPRDPLSYLDEELGRQPAKTATAAPKTPSTPPTTPKSPLDYLDIEIGSSPHQSSPTGAQPALSRQQKQASKQKPRQATPPPRPDIDAFGQPTLMSQIERDLKDPNAGRVTPRLAAAERERKRYESRSTLGQMGEDIATGFIQGAQPLIKGANRVMGAVGAIQGIGYHEPLPTLTPEAQTHLQQQVEASPGLRSEITRGTVGGLTQAPAIIGAGALAGIPGILGYNALTEDYSDPVEAAKRIAINTAVPAGAGKLVSAAARPLIRQITTPLGQTAGRIGAETLGGAAGNVAAAAGMGETDPQKLISQGIIGGALSAGLGARSAAQTPFEPQRLGPPTASRRTLTNAQIEAVRNEPLPPPQMNRMNRAQIARPQTEVTKVPSLEAVTAGLEAKAANPQEVEAVRSLIMGKEPLEPVPPQRASFGRMGPPNIPENAPDSPLTAFPDISPPSAPKPYRRSGTGLGSPNIPEVMSQPPVPRRTPIQVQTSAPEPVVEQPSAPPMQPQGRTVEPPQPRRQPIQPEAPAPEPIPEKSPELTALEAKYKEDVARVKGGPLNRQDKGSSLRALGERFAAEKRRLTGTQTEKERARDAGQAARRQAQEPLKPSVVEPEQSPAPVQSPEVAQPKPEAPQPPPVATEHEANLRHFVVQQGTERPTSSDPLIQARIDWVFDKATPEQVDRSIKRLEQQLPQMEPGVAERQQDVLDALNVRRNQLRAGDQLEPKYERRKSSEGLRKGEMQQMQDMTPEQRDAFAKSEDARRDSEAAARRAIKDARVAANKAARGVEHQVDAEGVAKGQPRTYTHARYPGQTLTASPNQKGVGKGRIRVTEEDGVTEHVIKDPYKSGNREAAPVRQKKEAAFTGTEPLSIKPEVQAEAAPETNVADTIRQLKPRGGPVSIKDLRAKGVTNADIQAGIDSGELQPTRGDRKINKPDELLGDAVGVQVKGDLETTHPRKQRPSQPSVPRSIPDAMMDLDPKVRTGAPISLTDLRAATKSQFPDSASFDKAVIDAANRGDIVLQKHVSPDSLSEAEKAGMVKDKVPARYPDFPGQMEDAYFIGAAVRPEKANEVFSKPSATKGKPKFVTDAEQRLREVASGKRSGSGAQALVDQAIVTGHQVYRAGMQFQEWAREVVKIAGEKIRPHLKAAWNQINDRVSFGPDPRTRADVEKSPAFRRFFQGSKVVDENGNPKIVYHSTQGDFDIFRDTADVGFHFGTQEAANTRAETPTYFKNHGKQEFRDKSSVVPVYLSIKNPLKVGDVFSTSADTLDRLMELGHIDRNDPNFANIKELLKKGDIDSKKALQLRRAGIVQALEEQGYDGLEYTNKAEDPGSTSYVAFHPQQIKSAIGNRGTFSRYDPSIMGMGFGALQGGMGKRQPPPVKPANIPGRLNLAALEKAAGQQEVKQKRTAKGKAPQAQTIPEKVSTLRKAGFLGGIPTHLRNISGNTIFQAAEEGSRAPGVVADMLLSTVTGRRTLTGPSALAVVRAGIEGGKQGIAEAKQIIRKGQTAEQAALSQRAESDYKNPILKWYTQGIFRSLSAEDAIFRNVALRRSLEGRAKAQALTEAKQGQIPRNQVKTRTEDLIKNPTDEISKGALEDSLVAVFQNDNRISKGTEAFRRELSPGGKATMDVFLPYDKTPTNILLKTLDYSPAGFVRAGLQATNAIGRGARSVMAQRKAGETGFKRIVKKAIDDAVPAAEQKKFAETVGRATTGSTAFLALGALLHSKGMLTGYYGDKDEEKRNEAAGKQPGSLLVGGRSYRIDSFGPPGALLVLGATLAREYERPLKDEDERLGRMGKAAGETVSQVPFLEAAKQANEILRGEGKTGAKLGRLVGGFVPTVANIGRMTDPYEREGGTFTSEIQKQIPGLRNMLPKKQTATGEAIEREYRGILDPTNSRPVKETPLLNEMEDLGMGIGLVRKKDDETEENFKARSTFANRLFKEAGETLAQHERFKELTPTQKEAAIKSLKIRAAKESAEDVPDMDRLDADTVIDAILATEQKRADKKLEKEMMR